MTDEELSEFLHLSKEEASIVIPKLTKDQRLAFERMKSVILEAALWMDGLGPKPSGVLLDTEHSTKRRKLWR